MELGRNLLRKVIQIESLEEKTISSPWIDWIPGGSRQ
jgi:hypothetical protein